MGSSWGDAVPGRPEPDLSLFTTASFSWTCGDLLEQPKKEQLSDKRFWYLNLDAAGKLCTATQML